MISVMMAGFMWLATWALAYGAGDVPVVVGSPRITSHFFVLGEEECPDKIRECRAVPIRPPAEVFESYRNTLAGKGFRVLSAIPKSVPFYSVSAHHVETAQYTCTVEGEMYGVGVERIYLNRTYVFPGGAFDIGRDVKGVLQISPGVKREILAFCVRSFAAAVADRIRDGEAASAF
jgi:hypothetical protein